MADNPLYPGYVPKDEEEAVSSAYPGYYPGAPISRRTASGGYVKPSEYNIDSLMEGINEIDLEIGDTAYFVRRHIVDDFKKSLTAAIKPVGVKASELDDYDFEALPGAMGMALSLNPEDWREPGKQAVKTLKQWTNKIIDTRNPLDNKDLDVRMKREIWREALGLESPDGIIRAESGTRPLRSHFSDTAQNFVNQSRETAVQEKIKRLTVGQKVSDIPGYDGNPIDFGHVGIKATETIVKRNVPTFVVGGAVTPQGTTVFRDVTETREVDVFREVAHAIVDFKESEELPRFRDSAHDTFLQTSLNATSTELNKFLRLNEENNLGRLTDKDKTIIKDYGKINEVSLSMKNLESKYDNTSKAIKKVIMGIPEDTVKLEEWAQTLQESRRKIEEFRNTVSGDTQKKIGKYLRQYEEHLDKSEKLLKKLEVSGSPGQYSLKGANKQEIVKDLGALRSGKWVDPGIMGGGDFLDNVQRGFLRQVVENDIVGAGKDVTGVHNIIRDNQLHSQKIQLMTNKIAIDRRTAKISDINSVIEKDGIDGIIEREIWNPIQSKIQVFTPSYWVERGLEKVDHFGLIIDEDNLLRKDKNQRANTLFGMRKQKEIRKMGEDPTSVNAPGFLTGNYFRTSVDINGKSQKVRVWGGAHFNIIKESEAFLKKEGNIDVKVDGLLALRSFTKGRKITGDDINNFKNFADRLQGFTDDERNRLAGILKNFSLYGDSAKQTEWLRKGLITKEQFDKNRALLLKFTGAFEGSGKDLPLLNQTFKKFPSFQAFLLKFVEGNVSEHDWAGMITLADQDDSIRVLLNHFFKDYKNRRNITINDGHFLNWLEKNKKKIFGKNADIADKSFLRSFVTSLSKEQRFKGSLDVNRRFSGLLQKTWTELNRLQEIIFASAIGKYLAFLSNWKTIVSEFTARVISEVLGKIITAIVGASTAGIGILLERVITPVIRFLTKKVLDSAQKIVGALVKGDILNALDELGEEAAKSIRKYLSIAIIPILVFAALINLFNSVVVTSISPVDETRGSTSLCKGTEFTGLFAGSPYPFEYLSEVDTYLQSAGFSIDEEVLEVYAQAEEQTGVPCEILAGIHHREGGNNFDQSLIDGSRLPSHGHDTLLESAIAAANIFKSKFPMSDTITENIFDGWAIDDVIRSISWYNGGGNRNCGWPGTIYTGPCPPPIGIDDPYVMNWYDEDHDPMNLIYCIDGVTCQNFCPTILECVGGTPVISTTRALNPTIREYCLTATCVGGTPQPPTTWPILRGPGALVFGIWFHRNYVGS